MENYEVKLFDTDHEKEIVKRRYLQNIPFDKYVDGKCYHATGYEILFRDDQVWYTEYEDSTGEPLYGN